MRNNLIDQLLFINSWILSLNFVHRFNEKRNPEFANLYPNFNISKIKTLYYKLNELLIGYLSLWPDKSI